jgi:hypothetical protein
MAEQLTLNQRVAGSSPARLTTIPFKNDSFEGGRRPSLLGFTFDSGFERPPRR